MKRNRNGVNKVTDEQIAAMANTGVTDVSVDQTVAERSGSDDKVAAVALEGAAPLIPTYTADGREWIERDPFGLKTEGLYGQRGQYPLMPEDLKLHAQFLGRPLDASYLETVLHGPDPDAPASMVSAVTGETLTSFVRTAMIDRETGDLKRDDRTGQVIYRGQFVVTGKPLAVHASETGSNLYELRNIRKQRKTLNGGRQVADLLYAQSFAQANARLTGIQTSNKVKQDAREAQRAGLQQRVGFASMGDARRRNPTRDEHGFDRGSATPSLPRGQVRKQRRWTENDATE